MRPRTPARAQPFNHASAGLSVSSKSDEEPKKQLQESNTTLVRGRQREFEHLNLLRTKLQAKMDRDDLQQSKSKAISFLNESKSSVMTRSKPSERMTVLDILEAAVVLIQKNLTSRMLILVMGNGYP